MVDMLIKRGGRQCESDADSLLSGAKLQIPQNAGNAETAQNTVLTYSGVRRPANIYDHNLDDCERHHQMVPVPGFHGYSACSNGQIWTFRNARSMGPRVLCPRITMDGYFQVRLSVFGSSGKSNRLMVHRIICRAFHGEPASPELQVRHLDGVKTNNASSNLAWGTVKENAEDRDRHGNTVCGENSPLATASDADVLAAVHLVGRGAPVAIVATWIGVSAETVHNWVGGRLRDLPKLSDMAARL